MPILFGVTSDAKVIPFQVDEVGILFDGSHGWISGTFQKNPLAFGYSGIVHRYFYDTDLSAGASNVSDSVVPAGEIWVITFISVWYIGTVTNVTITVQTDGPDGALTLYRVITPTSDQTYDRQPWLVLREGDYLEIYVTGATLHDDVYCVAHGFRVDIDQ